MAIYRIFPENDTFIFTENVTGNAGLDEINEIGGYPVAGVGQACRKILKVKTADIQTAINNKVGANLFTASLHLSLASAYELPQSYTLYSYPIYDSYTPGVGKYGDVPVDTSGVAWTFPTGYESADSTKWSTPLYATVAGVTGSYKESGSLGYGGGGAWYYLFYSVGLFQLAVRGMIFIYPARLEQQGVRGIIFFYLARSEIILYTFFLAFSYNSLSFGSDI